MRELPNSTTLALAPMPDAPKDESTDTNGSDTSEGIEINADSIDSQKELQH